MKNKRKIRYIIISVILLGIVIALGYFNQRWGLANLIRTNLFRNGTIVILDPGHGGHDPGCGDKEPYEKEITLQIMEKVKKELEKDGIIVVMTREDDTFISLGDRVLCSRVNRGDMFVSVHLNWADNTEAEGVETYCNESLNEYSKILADALQREVLEKTGAEDRKVRSESDYYVVRNSKVPSCLIEVGFLSSNREGEQLKTDAYQNQIAKGIADGINQYVKEIEESE